MDADEEIRERQLLVVAQKMGTDSEVQVRSLIQSAGLASAEQRLPLLEVAFPALKRRPPDFITRVLDAVKALVEADGRIDVFEYLLARVITMYLWESHNPHRVRVSGNKTLAACRQEALQVLGVLAQHGSPDTKSRLLHFGRDDCTWIDRDKRFAARRGLGRHSGYGSAKARPAQIQRQGNAGECMVEVVLHDGRLVLRNSSYCALSAT